MYNVAQTARTVKFPSLQSFGPTSVDQTATPASGSAMQQSVQDNLSIQSRHLEIGRSFGSAFVGGDPTPPPEPFLQFGPTPSHSQLSALPTQTIGVQWRPKEPQVFFGRVSGDADTWTSTVSNYFVFVQGSLQQEMEYAPTLL